MTDDNIEVSLDPEVDASAFAVSMFNTALETERELMVLKLKDTVIRSGYHPYSEAGASLVDDLMTIFTFEDVEDEKRPIEKVWKLVEERGFVPEWVPNFETHTGCSEHHDFATTHVSLSDGLSVGFEP